MKNNSGVAAAGVSITLMLAACTTAQQRAEPAVDLARTLPVPEDFRIASERASMANECFERARGVLDGWWALRDPVTGFFPRRVDDPRWAPADNAADCFPFLVLSAHFTRPELLDGLREVLRREVELTTRIGWLPDWYSIPRRQFQHAEPDLGRILFGAAEYAKDGLNPLIELDGPEPWSSRLRQLLDGIIEVAPIESDFGLLPAADTETNGELLQSLTRFYCATGEEAYIEFAERIGDAYCLEVLPQGNWLPAHRWDFSAHEVRRDELNLNDHGNEIIGGLAELFVCTRAAGRESAKRYEEPLRRMFDTLLEKARNDDGIWYGRVRASTGEVLSEHPPDTWGYALSGALAFGLATEEPRYIDAVRTALRGIDQEHYLKWRGADAYADAIEGALLVLNHLPEPAGFRWIEKMLPIFFSQQKLQREGGTGIVEGWYGDGNYARTALMVALYGTQGTSVQPWKKSVLLGAQTRDETLHVSLTSAEPWSGRLHFDHPRHRDHFHLPWDYPRLNSYPEWFTLEAGELYELRTISHAGGVMVAEEERVLGLELLAGWAVELKAGDALFMTVTRAGQPPFGEERGVADPLAHLEAGAGDPALIASVDLSGNGEYAGETYRWCEDAPIEWRVQREAGATDCTLWLRWGSKVDRRSAHLSIGTHSTPLDDGGWDGFSWLTVDIPTSWWDGDRLVIGLEAPVGPGKSAFLSSMRLRASSFRPQPEGPSLRIEVEEFDGEWKRQDNIPGFTGSGFRVSNATGIAANTLRLERPLPTGAYFVWARGYEGGGLDRRFEISIGTERFEATHRGRWSERFSWQLAGHVELEQGTHELKLRDAGPDFEVADAIWLTTDPFFDPGAQDRIAHAISRPSDSTGFLELVIEESVARAAESHRQIAESQVGLDHWKAERSRLQSRLGEALGLDPLPPRTPLAARTVGVLERDGYRVERVVFESRPGFLVTANLYLPDSVSAGGHPAVLCPGGHWALAKTEPVIQARCIALAKQGFVALTYDPFGQGERDVPGNDHYEYFRSILVGRNNMSFMVWDTIRALDYLCERPEVDPARIACTGASGGGLNTLYAAAIDKRIAVAVPVVYVTRLKEFLETRHSHCPCSHVNGLADFADMGDIIALNAPRPTLLLTASDDTSFTPAGARGAADQARTAFELYDASQALEVREFDGGHGYDRPMREALLGWLVRHLKGEGDGQAISEGDIHLEEDPSTLHCFEGGRVPGDTVTVRDLCRARAKALASREPRDLDEVRKRIAELIGVVPGALAREAPIDAGLSMLHGKLHSGQTPTWTSFLTSAGPPLIGWRLPGEELGGPLVVLVTEEFRDAEHEQLLKVHAANPGGIVVLELRWTNGGGAEYVLATNAHLLGDPLLGRSARALCEILALLRSEAGPDRPLIAIGDGDQPSLALTLAQLAGAGADEARVDETEASFVNLFDQALPAADVLAWGLLEVADLPWLRSCAHRVAASATD